MKSGTKKTLAVLGVLLAALLVLVLYYGFKLTRGIDPQWAQDPNPVEGFYANSKIRRLSNETSRAGGYVRLSEVEINSYLQDKVRSFTNSGPSSVVLDQAAILLGEKDLTFVCWTRANFLGLELPLVYQRFYKPGETNSLAALQLESIRIGELDIPKVLWAEAESFFATMDTRFQDGKRWIAGLPAIQLTRNELTKNPEVRLYNFQPRDL